MAPVANVANRMRPSAGSPNTLGGAGDGGGEDGCGEGGGDDGDGGGAAVSGAGIRGGGSSVVWEEDSRRGRTRVGATERVCLLRPKPPSSPVMNRPRMSSGVSHPACGARRDRMGRMPRRPASLPTPLSLRALTWLPAPPRAAGDTLTLLRFDGLLAPTSGAGQVGDPVSDTLTAVGVLVTA
jgi:hypothetical protein